jgi:hypothetical protein
MRHLPATQYSAFKPPVWGRLEAVLGSMWQATTRPKRFFAGLEEAPTRLLLAFGVALTSYLAGVFALSLAFLRLTASDALLPIFVLASAAGSLHLLFMWGVGGFLLQIPAALDARAWEVAGWSWSPLFFLSLALLPLGYLVPFLAVALLVLGFLSWHLVVVNSALQVLVPGSVNRALATYALVLFGVPIATVTLGIYAIGAL